MAEQVSASLASLPYTQPLRAPGAERLPGTAATRPDLDEFFRTRFGI
ncbi:hypothetical protein SBI_00788 [Streptomyces bingchenggensis BCW-1]|uniref:Uncharacterized protein n=1 Tax=Streptomyces bingchenggensis (strain BCW-1) TaxID=749414 RepID=D7C487_STRBB|nr:MULTISPECIES: hypothetical protein [Streptomyces]ADI03909.1 hypothetical protein SBI_00788 [Streptomyces bingchenggensis BCW-1]